MRVISEGYKIGTRTNIRNKSWIFMFVRRRHIPNLIEILYGRGGHNWMFQHEMTQNKK